MERMWHYTIGGKDPRGPIPESELRALIEAGQLSRAELVWSEGMAEWEPLSQRVEFSAFDSKRHASADDLLLAAPPPVTSVVAAQSALRDDRAPAPFGGWLTFVGIMNILGGCLLTLTCVGIPLGVLMIIAGAAAMGARTALDGVRSPPGDYAPALAKFRTYFVLTGVMFLLQLVGFLLVLVNMSGMALMLSRMAEQIK